MFRKGLNSGLAGQQGPIQSLQRWFDVPHLRYLTGQQRCRYLNALRHAFADNPQAQMELTVGIDNRIYTIMEAKGLSQKEFAHLVGKTETEVSRWLSGTHNPTVSTLAKISAALGEDILVPSAKKPSKRIPARNKKREAQMQMHSSLSKSGSCLLSHLV